MTGGEGTDRLPGGNGDDTLSEGAGDDMLKGDMGADSFVFATGGRRDLIVNFDGALDRLTLDIRL